MAKGAGSYIREKYRSEVLAEVGCYWCGCLDGVFHVDHIIPPKKGGNSFRDNLVKACARCNTSKADRTLTDWVEHSTKKRDHLRMKTNAVITFLARVKRRSGVLDLRMVEKLRQYRLEHSKLSRRIGTATWLNNLLYG